jgi:osmotically-inducible protein OsmY
MNERQTGEGRQDRWTSQGERRSEGDGGSERSMTRSQGGGEMEQQGNQSGNWTGYVVPYRYYGPGYRGVGYYSVMYQGSGEEQAGGDEWDESGRSERQGTGSGSSGTSGSRYGGSGYGGASGYRGGRGYAGGSSYGGGGYGGGRGHSGRGPKGYQRSDERIQEEVNDRLMADDRIDASEIEVQVKGGEATLTGTVPDRWMKRMAEDLVEQVMGVREVMNQIRVTQNQFGEEGQTGQGGRQSGQTSRSGGSRTGQSSRTTAGTTSSSQTNGDQAQGESNGRRQKAGTTSR